MKGHVVYHNFALLIISNIIIRIDLIPIINSE